MVRTGAKVLFSLLHFAPARLLTVLKSKVGEAIADLAHLISLHLVSTNH